MNILKHKLTEEEKEYISTCLEYINSNDYETSRLGISLFYERFNTYRFEVYVNGKLRLLKIHPNKGFYFREIMKCVCIKGYCYY